MRYSPGNRTGPYVIGALLGAGGMGEVYRASDTRLGREVALKVLSADFARDPEWIARFEQEARSASALNHPNILSIHDIGTQAGSTYIVSELIQGETLRKILSRGPVPLRRLVDVFGQIAEGLGAAHSAGIIHRDLKPENIMLTREGWVKILDFGLAKRIDVEPNRSVEQTTEVALTQPGKIMGTFSYMSPEQIRGEVIDARSDIFSLGLIGHEMTTGQSAYHKPSAVETMHAILNEEPPALGPDVPAALATVLLKCLNKEVDGRFQSAADLGFVVKRVVPIGSTAGISAEHKVTRRTLLWSSGAVVCGVAGAGGGYFWPKRRPDPPRFHELATSRMPTIGILDPQGQIVVYRSNSSGGSFFAHEVGTGYEHELRIPADGLLQDLSSRRELAFIRQRTLYSMGLDNSAPRALTTMVLQARWSVSGDDLAILRRMGRECILEYPIGKPIRKFWDARSLAGANRDGLISVVAFSSDGQAWLIVVDSLGRDRYRRLLSKSGGALDQRAIWSPNQKEIWAAAFESGESEGTLVAYGLNGTRRVLAGLPEPVELCGIGPMGHALLRMTAELDTAFAKPADAAEARPLQVDAMPAAITSNGRSLVLQSQWLQDESSKVWFQDLKEGSNPILLGRGGVVGISPDAKWVGVVRPPRVYSLIPVDAGQEEELHVPGIKQAILMGWHPDGRLLIKESSLNTNREQLYLWRRGASRAEALPVNAANAHVFGCFISPDGQDLLMYHDAQDSYIVEKLSGGSLVVLEGVRPKEYLLGWTSTPGFVYVASGRSPTVDIEIYNVETRARRPWKVLSSNSPDAPITDIFITPTGAAFAYAAPRISSRLVTAEALPES